MSTFREERRLDRAQEREQDRADRREEREAKLADQRAQREHQRRDQREAVKRKVERRASRAAWRRGALAPGSVYRRGTLALVTVSALASLPAQVLHFTAMTMLLLPVPFALEGAAWVLAAGVAYADELRLPAWVRWLLRGLSLSAAAFAASINYDYGIHLSGLAPAEARAAGLGLAAVTLGGPLLFEVRQWVCTLTAQASDAHERATARAQARQQKQRRRRFRAVWHRYEDILAALPCETADREAVWQAAWRDVHGAKVGTTSDVVAARLAADRRLEDVFDEAGLTPEAAAVESFLADLFPAPGVGDTDDPPRNGGDLQQGSTTLGGKGLHAADAPSGKKPRPANGRSTGKPLADADVDTVRELADRLGGADKLSANNVRKAIGCRTDYAIRLRDAVKRERGVES